VQAAILRKFGYIALAAAVATLLITGLLLLEESRRYNASFEATNQARQTLLLSQNLIDDVVDAETGQRGYLLTGKADYLAPYNAARRRIPDDLKQLAELEGASNNGLELRQLHTLIDSKLAELERTIALSRSADEKAAVALVQTDEGQRLMTDIRRLADRMDQEENARWLVSESQLVADQKSAGIVILLGTCLLVALVAGGGLAMRAATAQTDRTMAELDRAKIATERQSELLRTTLYSIGDAVIATDREGAVQMMNEVAQQLTGFTEREAFGKPIEEIFHIVNETTRAEVENPVRRVLREGKVVGLANHTVLISRTGVETAIDDSGAPVAAPGSPSSGVVLVFRDVSERKKAFDTARRLAAIVEDSDDAIIGKTLEGVVVSWNRGAERLFGYSAEEMLGQPISRIVPADRADDTRRILEGVARGESVDHYQTDRVTKDGRRITVTLTVSPIRNEDGRIIGASKIARDVTHERQMEEHLRQTQKMEAMGRLAGGVAHDFNNLLTVIFGYATLLQSRIDPEDPQHETVGKILSAAEQAASITGQLLAFSRKQVTQAEILDLNEAVLESRDMLHRLMGEDIDLAVFLDNPRCPVKIDRGQLTQVLLNLAVNARDAMPLGGKLTIQTRHLVREREDLGRLGIRPAGIYVELAVTDSGIGMDSETQRQIFEPFFTTKEAGKGVGLGLATVYGVVQQHGGFIDVYSEPGHGTAFKMFFPLAAGAAQKGSDGPVPAGARRTGTILLVEDQAPIRMLAEDVLSDAGHRVLTAANGRIALQVADSFPEPIDILVTDVVMPEMSGPELAAQLTRARPDLVVLYISGFTDHALFQRGVIEQGTAFLQKPFRPEALLQKVDTLWKKDLSAEA